MTIRQLLRPDRNNLLAGALLFFFLLLLFVFHNPDSHGSLVSPASGLILLLWALIFLNSERRKIILSVLFGKGRWKKNIAAGMVLIILPLVSLFYSTNSTFGSRKWLGLAFDVLPLSFTFASLIILFGRQLFTRAAFLILAAAIVLSGLLFFHKPISFDNTVNFYYWSYVGLGRILGFSMMTALAALLYARRQSLPFFTIALLIIETGVLLCGLRAAFIGTVVMSLLMLLYSARDKKVERSNLILGAAVILFIIPAGFVLKDLYPSPINRYINLSREKVDQYGPDSTISGRRTAILLSSKMIAEKPVFGRGLGGFNMYYEGIHAQKLQYPHNIFLEITVELGIAGLFFFIILLIIMMKKAYILHPMALALLLYALWLALFAGNLPDQKVFWLGLGIAAIPTQYLRRLKVENSIVD
jgi:O-antigen ligase